MKIFSIKSLLFLFVFFESNALIYSGNDQSSKKNRCWVRTGCFNISLDLFADYFEAYKKNPKTISLLASMLLGASLYSTEIKDYILNNREKVLIGGMSTFAFCALFKKPLLRFFEKNQFEDDFSEKNEEGSENNIYNFSKSGVRIYCPGEIKTNFEDVAGLETAKDDLSDILMFLQDPTIFKEMGAKIPKGILLSGAPGNGKTLLARALAGEVQCPFLYVNASEFIEAIVGIGAARVRSLFAIAKAIAPCIIFIDEIDAIGRKRSVTGFGGGDTELAQTLNQLLAEMDGFEQNENPIVIIGATNRADVLDQALIRPGRFDRKIEIHAPYLKDRIKILEVHFKDVVTDFSLDIQKIALGTSRFSGAELAQLVNEAAILAVREGACSVNMYHVDKARDYMLMGRETRGMDISYDEYWCTAVHEAGHALAHVYQKDAVPLYKVTIEPRGGALGLTWFMDNKERHSKYIEECKAEIVACLGGSVAEELVYGGRGAGARSDLEKARQLATEMVMRYGMSEEFKDVSFSEFIENQVQLPDTIATKLHEEVSKIIQECRAVAVQILTEHREQLELLVEMLLEHGTVFGNEVYALCKIEEPEIVYSIS